MTSVNLLTNIKVMKKETIIAVVFGIVLGGIMAVVIISKTREKQLEQTKTIAPLGQANIASSSTNNDLQPLEISYPTDGLIVNKDNVTIKGKAEEGSLIIVQSPFKDLVVQNKNKDFSIDFPLAYGENIIRINVYPKNKQLKPQEKELKVYYLEESL